MTYSYSLFDIDNMPRTHPSNEKAGYSHLMTVSMVLVKLWELPVLLKEQ